MPKTLDVHSIIVPAQSANISAHTYTEIYGGSVGCTIVINNQIISIGAASNVEVLVSSVSGGTGCYLLGEKQNVFQGSTLLG